MKIIKAILKAFLLYFLAIHFLLFSAIRANADAMPRVPETGKPETHGSLTVDHSHASDGYIIVKAVKSDRKLKVEISLNGTAKIHYNLNTDGEEEILPLQYGDGKYTVSLYRQLNGTRYQKDGETSFSVKMPDQRGYMLYPNQWVNYTADTETDQLALD